MSAEYGTDKPLLDARLQGSSIYTAAGNSDTDHYFTFNFDCKLNGFEIYSECQEIGHWVSFETQYFAGPYGWKRYKRFGKQWHLFPGNVCRVILFPTTPSAGVRVAMKYHNPSANEAKFAINIFTFTDQEIVNPGILQEGTDW